MNKKYYIFIIFVSLFIIGCSSNNEVKTNDNGGKTVENKTEITEETFHDQFVAMAESMNEQCPIKVDEITTYKNVSFSEKSIVIKTIIANGYLDKIDFDVFKLRMTENFSRSLDRQFVKLLAENDYSIKYLVSEEHDKISALVEITGKDILHIMDIDALNKKRQTKY